MKKPKSSNQRRQPDSLFVQGRPFHGTRNQKLSHHQTVNPTNSQKNRNTTTANANHSGQREYGMSRTSEGMKDIMNYYKGWGRIAYDDREDGDRPGGVLYASNLGQSQLRLNSEPDELDSRNSNIVRQELGNAWYEDGGLSIGYKDVQSPKVTKKQYGSFVNLSATQNRSAHTKSEMKDHKFQNCPATLNRHERQTNSSNETSYRSYRKQQMANPRHNDSGWQAGNSSQRRASSNIYEENQGRETSNLSNVSQLYPTHETAVTQMPHLFVTTTSTQSNGIRTSQVINAQTLKFLGPDGEVIAPREISPNQKYDLVFVSNKDSIQGVQFVATTTTEQPSQNIEPRSDFNIHIPQIQIDPSVRQQFNENLMSLRLSVQDQFKRTVDSMIDFLQQTPVMDSEEIQRQLLQRQADAIQWDLIAQSLGLGSFFELVVIYNMYNQDNANVSAKKQSRSTSKYSQRNLASGQRNRVQSVNTLRKPISAKSAKLLSRTAQINVRTRPHCHQALKARQKIDKSVDANDYSNQLTQSKNHGEQTQDGGQPAEKKKLVPDYICLHNDTDLFPLTQEVAPKKYSSHRERLLQIKSNAEIQRLKQRSVMKKEFARFHCTLAGKQGMTISQKELKPQQNDGRASSLKKEYNNIDLNLDNKKIKGKNKGLANIVEQIDTRRNSAAASLVDFQKTDQASLQSKLRSLNPSQHNEDGSTKLKQTSNKASQYMLLQQDDSQMESNKEEEFRNLLMSWNPSDLNFKRRKKANSKPRETPVMLSNQVTKNLDAPKNCYSNRQLQIDDIDQIEMDLMQEDDQEDMCYRHRLLSSKTKQNPDTKMNLTSGSERETKENKNTNEPPTRYIELSSTLPYENLIVPGGDGNASSDLHTGWEHSNTLKMAGVDGSPVRMNSNESINCSFIAKLISSPQHEMKMPQAQQQIGDEGGATATTEGADQVSKPVEPQLEPQNKRQIIKLGEMNSKQGNEGKEGGRQVSRDGKNPQNKSDPNPAYKPVKFELKKLHDFLELSKMSQNTEMENIDSNYATIDKRPRRLCDKEKAFQNQRFSNQNVKQPQSQNIMIVSDSVMQKQKLIEDIQQQQQYYNQSFDYNFSTEAIRQSKIQYLQRRRSSSRLRCREKMLVIRKVSGRREQKFKSETLSQKERGAAAQVQAGSNQKNNNVERIESTDLISPNVVSYSNKKRQSGSGPSMHIPQVTRAGTTIPRKTIPTKQKAPIEIECETDEQESQQTRIVKSPAKTVKNQRSYVENGTGLPGKQQIMTPAAVAGGWSQEKEMSFAQDQENNLKLLREIAVKNLQNKRSKSNQQVSRYTKGSYSQMSTTQHNFKFKNEVASQQNPAFANKNKIAGNSVMVAAGSYNNNGRPRTSVGIHQHQYETFLGGGHNTLQSTAGGIKDYSSTSASQKLTQSQTTKQIYGRNNNENVMNLVENTFWGTSQQRNLPKKSIYNTQWRPGIAQYTDEVIELKDSGKSRNAGIHRAGQNATIESKYKLGTSFGIHSLSSLSTTSKFYKTCGNNFNRGRTVLISKNVKDGGGSRQSMLKSASALSKEVSYQNQINQPPTGSVSQIKFQPSPYNFITTKPRKQNGIIEVSRSNMRLKVPAASTTQTTASPMISIRDDGYIMPAKRMKGAVATVGASASKK